jgi:hypothetical protein
MKRFQQPAKTRRQQSYYGCLARLAQLSVNRPKPTLPPVKGPTLAEIEAKYGELRK